MVPCHDLDIGRIPVVDGSCSGTGPRITILSSTGLQYIFVASLNLWFLLFFFFLLRNLFSVSIKFFKLSLLKMHLRNFQLSLSNFNCKCISSSHVVASVFFPSISQHPLSIFRFESLRVCKETFQCSLVLRYSVLNYFFVFNWLFQCLNSFTSGKPNILSHSHLQFSFSHFLLLHYPVRFLYLFASVVFSPKLAVTRAVGRTFCFDLKLKKKINFEQLFINLIRMYNCFYANRKM